MATIQMTPGEVSSLCLDNLRTQSGRAITTGATVTFAAFTEAMVLAAEPVTALSGGSDDWCASFTAPSVEGVYVLRVTIVEGGITTTEDHVLIVAVSATVPPTAVSALVGVTLAQMRRMVARRLRDLRTVTATATGSTTTLTDEDELTDADDAWVGSQGVVVVGAAANIGKTVRVTQSDEETSTITFKPALPAGIAAGDQIDLTNLAGQGFRVRDYTAAIGEAVTLAYPDFAVERRDGAGVFSKATPVLPVPAGMTEVFKVEYRDPANDRWREVRPAAQSGDYYPGFWISTESREVRLQGGWVDLLDGCEVRVLGYGLHPPVEQEGDPIYCDAEWVMYSTMAALASRRGSREWSSWGIEWQAAANGRRGHLMIARYPNSQRVR